MPRSAGEKLFERVKKTTKKKLWTEYIERYGKHRSKSKNKRSGMEWKKKWEIECKDSSEQKAMTTTNKKSTARAHTHTLTRCTTTGEKNGNSYFLYNYKRISSLSSCIVSARSQINGDPYVQYDTISIILNHFSHFHLVSSVLFPTFSTYIFFSLFLSFCRVFFSHSFRTPTCATLWYW